MNWTCGHMGRNGDMSDIEFHFDFGSPNAYLAHRVIPGIEARIGARFGYVPILLGGIFKATNNRSPGEAFANILNKRAFMELETQRFLARHGIADFRRNPFFPVNTLTLMRGAVAAQHEGCFDRYVEVVFHNMWSEPKKMDEPDVVRAVLEANGFDAGRLLERTQSTEVKQELVRNTEASVARGAFGSPTFFVGDEIFFGKDQLRDVEERSFAATADSRGPWRGLPGTCDFASLSDCRPCGDNPLHPRHLPTDAAIIDFRSSRPRSSRPR
jgi:2-hydroxychromene-2-carboxylate isomerase